MFLEISGKFISAMSSKHYGPGRMRLQMRLKAQRLQSERFMGPEL